MKTAPDSPDETSRQERRSEARMKAAATRRKNEEEERKDFRNARFLVIHEDEIVAMWEVNKSYRKDEAGVEWVANLENVVTNLVKNFDPADAEDDVTNCFGFEAPCLAVWNCGQLLAIVRRGPDGRPVGTIF